jgi:hypothetical protein
MAVMDKVQSTRAAGPVAAGPSMAVDLQSFIVIAFPFPQPVREKDQKLRAGSQQLGQEFFDGLAIMYSYSEDTSQVQPVRSRQSPMSVDSELSDLTAEDSEPVDSDSEDMECSIQLSVRIFNRRLNHSSNGQLEVAMLLFTDDTSSYHRECKPLSSAAMVWHKCPPLNCSRTIFNLTLTSRIDEATTRLHLFIKSPTLKPQVAPFSRVSELTFMGKTIQSISPCDLTFLIYLRYPRNQEDSDAVGILRGSHEALSTITTHFESCGSIILALYDANEQPSSTDSNFSEADLIDHPKTMPPIDFEAWDDDSDLEDSGNGAVR